MNTRQELDDYEYKTGIKSLSIQNRIEMTMNTRQE